MAALTLLRDQDAFKDTCIRSKDGEDIRVHSFIMALEDDMWAAEFSMDGWMETANNVSLVQRCRSFVSACGNAYAYKTCLLYAGGDV
jgi:hypothetical protein